MMVMTTRISKIVKPLSRDAPLRPGLRQFGFAAQHTAAPNPIRRSGVLQKRIVAMASSGLTFTTNFL
jgi:hypothetical protein